MDNVTGFLVAGFALAGSPGPATLSLAATGAAFGAVRGAGYMAGIIFGMVLVITVTASGVTGLVLAVPGAAPALAVPAAAYIAWLALRIATAPPLAAGGSGGERPGFGGGLLLSLANPKGWAAMAALLSGFVLVEGNAAADAGLKLALLVAIMTVVDTAWLLLGAALTRPLQQPRLNRAINVTFSVLLLASVALALGL